MRKIARAVAGSFLLTAFLVTPALAQSYPPDEPTVGVSDSTVFPCDAVVFTGANFEPGTTVDVTLDGEVVATALVEADGTFSVSVTIPCATTPGTHVLGAGGVNTVITVLSLGGGVPGGGPVVTPGTGANLGAGIFILAALLVIGVMALVATRRRVRVAQPQRVAE